MRCTYESPIGRLLIEETDGAIVRIRTAERTESASAPTPAVRRCIAALDAYFRGNGRSFSFPIAPGGTAFQQKVWEELRRIPYGSTASYREVALRCCGSARYARAVAMAAHKNPILLAIPCHRMISADGSSGGFALGTDAKRFLLELETEKPRK